VYKLVKALAKVPDASPRFAAQYADEMLPREGPVIDPTETSKEIAKCRSNFEQVCRKLKTLLPTLDDERIASLAQEELYGPEEDQ